MVRSTMTDKAENSDEHDPRVICFDRHEDWHIFEESVAKLIQRRQKQSRDHLVSEENVLRMKHGSTWVHAARVPEPGISMVRISAEWTIPFKGIAENDLTLIPRTILSVSNSMERQFAQNIYSVVGAAAEEAGNIVDAQKEGSFARSMLEMFKKIEFGVDRDGNVSLPQIHVGSDIFRNLEKEIQNTPPALQAEIEQVKAGKIEAALRKEVERKAKFKNGAI